MLCSIGTGTGIVPRKRRVATSNAKMFTHFLREQRKGSSCCPVIGCFTITPLVWPAANAADRPVCVKRHVRRATLARYEKQICEKQSTLQATSAARDSSWFPFAAEKWERGNQITFAICLTDNSLCGCWSFSCMKKEHIVMFVHAPCHQWFPALPLEISALLLLAGHNWVTSLSSLENL